ncbi:hypothetical protein [Sphingobacterium hungaricum]
MFKIGDLVRFVDEPIEGHITSIQQNDIVGVTDETGFEIPVLKTKITLVHGNMRRDDDDFETDKPVQSGPFVGKGIYLAIRGDQNEGLAKFYIINETSFDVLFNFGELHGTKVTGLRAERIAQKDFLQVYSANFSAIGKWPTFQIQLLRFHHESQNLQPAITKEIKVKSMDLMQNKVKSELLEDKVWQYELDKIEENINLDKLKSHFISHRPNK